MKYVYTLRILTLLLCSMNAGLCFAGTAFQHITLSVKDAPAEKVFASIEKQSGFYFMYNNELLRKARPITMDVKDVTLQQAMEFCVKGQDFTFTIVDKIIVLKEKVRSSPGPGVMADARHLPLIDVSGRVADEQNKWLEGVSVTEKGTKNATVTNKEGYFLLKGINENAILVFSSIGYEEKEMELNGQTQLAPVKLRIRLGELSEVEVVSTGYQELPKERATGSFTKVGNRIYNQQVGTDVLSRLQHIANGLTVIPQKFNTSGTGIMIRGLSTFAAPRDPLIILDNFPYNGDYNNINPNDIESITLLKDAAATSIWGARAGNGVIVITTKKARLNQEPRIEFNANLTAIESPDLSYVPRMTTSDFIDVENFLFDNGFYDFRLPYPEYYAVTPVVNIRHQQQQGLISADEANAQINALRNLDVRDEFDRYFYNTGFNQQYALNLSGGSANHAWYLSGGFDNNKNELSETYRRYTLHFRNTYNIIKNLQLSGNLFYTNNKRSVGKPSFFDFTPSMLPPYMRFADADGIPQPSYMYKGTYRDVYLDTLGGGRLLDWKYYPLDDYKHIQNDYRLQDINAELGLRYDFSKNLNLDLRYRYQHQQAERRLHYGIGSFYARDIINTFTQIDYDAGTATYIVPRNGILDLTNSNITSQDLRGQVNFGLVRDRHNFNGVAGVQVSQVATNSNTNRTFGYDENIFTFSNVDLTKPHRHFVYGHDEFIPDPTGFSRLTSNIVSVYTNLSYTYNDRYTLSASGRRDASNVFGLNTNNKWKPLWSVGGAWEISRETFYKSSFLPYLKLRATYGHSGNIDPRWAAETTIRYLSTNPYTNTPIARVENFYNPDLKWEQVGMLNVGLDFKFRNDRIYGSIELYRKRMTDLFGGMPIDVTTGIGRSIIPRNVGSMRGNGVDFILNTVNIKGAIMWTSDLIINYYKDKVTRLNSKEIVDPATIVGGQGIGLEGYPVYSYFAYRWGGLDPQAGDPLGFIDGQTSNDYATIMTTGTKVDDLVYIGNVFPKVFGSIGNTLSWKNLALTTRITYKLGYYFRRSTIDYSSLFYTQSGHADYARRWQKPGDELNTTVPSMVYPDVSYRDAFYAMSEAVATKGDHIRLQYVRLEYTVNRSNRKRLPVSDLQIYALLQNAAMIWKANKEGIDPDFQDLKPQKNFTVGVRIVF